MEIFYNVKSVMRVGVRLFISEESHTIQDSMKCTLAVVADDEFGMSIPFKDGYIHPLSVKTPLEVYFFHGGGRYYFKTLITGRIVFDGKPILKCKMPISMIRTERRQYYRVDTMFPIQLFITFFEENEEGRTVIVKKYNANCVDISGGGLQLDCESSQKIPLSLEDVVDIDFCEALPDLARAKGVVVRSMLGACGIGIKFTSIRDADRDKIVRYVFKKQLDRRKDDFAEFS